MPNPDKLAEQVKETQQPQSESTGTQQPTAPVSEQPPATDGQQSATGDQTQVQGGDSAQPADTKVDAAPVSDETKVEAPATASGIPPVVPQGTTVRETKVPDDLAPQVERRDGSASANALMEQWLAYAVKADARKPQTPTQLLLMQRDLMRLIRSTANLDETQDFVQVSNYLVNLINENKTGAFSAGALFRLFDSNIESEANTNKARFALDAYLLFAEPKVRQANINTYNLLNSAQIATTAEKRDRFVAYFRRISGQR